MTAIKADSSQALPWMKITSEKLLVFISRGVDALGSLIFLKMLASVASKEDVGTYLLASSFLAVVLTVSFSAFDQGLLRNITDYGKRSELEARYCSMLFAYSGMASLMSVILAVVLTITHVGRALQPMLVPLALWLVCEVVKNLNRTVASGIRSRGLIAGASAADYGCRILLLAVVSVNAAWVSPSSIVSVLAFSSLVASLTYWISQRSWFARFTWADVRNTLTDSLRFAWPMILWGLFGWLQNMSNRWLLERFADLAAVAEYGVLISIASFPVTTLLGLVVTYIQPILYEQESSQVGAARQTVLKVTVALTPLCAVMVCVAALLHREITVLLSGPGYVTHSAMLPVIMAAACFNAVCSVLTYAVYAQRRVSALLLANSLPGVFSVIFGYYAVSTFKFEGAVLTLVLSHVLGGVLFGIAFWRAKDKVNFK